MSFQKSFPELLDSLLTDYENQLPAADRSQGSMLYIKAACTAAALWGIYRYQDWIAKQRLPSTADTPDDWAAEFGLTRLPDETDQALLQRLQETLRRAPAGGNEADYIRWAKEVAGVRDAIVLQHEPAGGLGMVKVVVTGTTEDEVAPEEVRQAVHDHISSLRPVGLYLLHIAAVEREEVDVTMTGSGPAWDPEACAAELTAYINSLRPLQSLYRSQLIAIGIRHGAETVTVVAPADDLHNIEGQTKLFRAGTIDVS